MARSKEQYWARRRAGLCPDCGKNVPSGQDVKCIRCKEANNARSRAYRGRKRKMRPPKPKRVKKRPLSPYQKILEAAKRGARVTLNRDDVALLAEDEGFIFAAQEDAEIREAAC